MCGISAIITKNKNYHDCIALMTERAKHRGPDAFEYFQDRHISFGHNRLKIIDLSDAANQPMEYDGCWIVFNGEIYNYKLLREKLVAKGHTFKTESDTEVLLHLYRDSFTIVEMLNQLRGMFAFVIYDERNRDVIAARDRFGIKPIYYTLLPGDGCAFASEIKQFCALPNWKPQINEFMKNEFLLSGLIDHVSNWTMFRDVFLIPPGHYVKLSPFGFTNVYPWYNLKEAVANAPTTSTFLTVQWLLKNAVELHLQSDVPVGACLSGGIDSTSIVCMINKIKKNKLFTVSARSENEFDEGRWINIVENYCGDIERHDIYPKASDLFHDLPKLVYHQDSPFPTTSMYAQWKVYEEAKKHVKVMLSGQGADELFAGYHMFFGARFASLIRRGNFLTLLKEARAANKIPGYDQSFVMKCAANALKNYPSVFDYSYSQVTRTSLPALLHWEDRNSMAHSIESRVPFLDSTLVEYIMAIPEEKKISDGTTKVILREAMRNLIPDEIVDRRDKIGFQTPEAYWFEQNKDKFIAKYVKAMPMIPQSMRSRCGDICTGIAPYTPELWRAITFAEFCEVFRVSPHD